MKPLITLIFLCLIALLACKKEKTANPSGSVIGKWTEIKSIDQEIVNDTVKTPVTTSFSDPNTYAQFNSDGTCTFSESVGNGNYSITHHNYKLSGTAIIFDSNEALTDTVKTLTANNMTLRWVFDYTVNGTHYRLTDDYYYTR